MSTERVALYASFSTLAGQNPEMQLIELREYASRRGWDVVEEYVDHGVSGAKEGRPALNRLMADAKQRRFDAIVVRKIDRFGRSLRHLVNSIAELENLGVSFISLRDSIDLSSPSGVLMFQLIAAMSQFERSLIRERVKAGLQNAKRKGKRLGRRPVEVDLSEIASLRHSGASWRMISEEMGSASANCTRCSSSVHKTCRNPPPRATHFRRRLLEKETFI
jgi:DNA invertase Pin-like site-specific DNA recombinase